MGFLGFHHLGTFLLLISFGLLLATTLSAPVTRIGLLKVFSPTEGDLVFGVFGYCQIISGADDVCSKASMSYSITDALNIAYSNTFINLSINKATYGLILHPISAGVTLLAFIIAALSHRFGFVFAAVIAAVAWLLTIVTLALDLAIFLPTRNKIIDAGGSVSYGVGIYCTLAAAVVLFLGAICTFFALFTDRKEKRRAKGAVYSFVPQPAVVMPQMQPSYSYGKY
ncbi:hypothetical protein BCR35DRAFT_299161 [Leucosporidium creatinivorum]|uniref:SUR7/PalI family-domain-containing protein n=1 Tax=Leucosporidium creatinivorum TaxID=106004 RepID=A0A1Y2G2T8_9BASI|nr:hypothetical protein BCR35DRAFT_299161 [Leucosporidium creatinivorum]